jgi:hypothetical protein
MAHRSFWPMYFPTQYSVYVFLKNFLECLIAEDSARVLVLTERLDLFFARRAGRQSPAVARHIQQGGNLHEGVVFSLEADHYTNFWDGTQDRATAIYGRFRCKRYSARRLEKVQFMKHYFARSFRPLTDQKAFCNPFRVEGLNLIPTPGSRCAATRGYLL